MRARSKEASLTNTVYALKDLSDLNILCSLIPYPTQVSCFEDLGDLRTHTRKLTAVRRVLGTDLFRGFVANTTNGTRFFIGFDSRWMMFQSADSYESVSEQVIFFTRLLAF
jgi:hypothetical protein